MVNQIAPFGRTALNDASPEVRRAVERTLGELISETRSFEQHSLFVELSVAR
ncbi:hypothetical protein [Microcella humidisoli]|nr:hypothetical protein [Microcella humidisoli]UTT63852.1 hypothetical protein NNL39_00005 [Microcella humidisoli]